MLTIGVVLLLLALVVFIGLAWMTLLCEGNTVRKLSILFILLAVKSLISLATLILVSLGILKISSLWMLSFACVPAIEILGAIPFGASMIYQVRKLRNGN